MADVETMTVWLLSIYDGTTGVLWTILDIHARIFKIYGNDDEEQMEESLIHCPGLIFLATSIFVDAFVVPVNLRNM